MQDHFNTAYNIAEEILKTLAPVTDKHIVTAVNQATMIYPDVDKELLKNTHLYSSTSFCIGCRYHNQLDVQY